MPLPWHADLAWLWLRLFGLAWPQRLNRLKCRSKCQVNTLMLSVSVTVSVQQAKNRWQQRSLVLQLQQHRLHQLQLQLQLQLCLRVICALFMQHSAHDETCNIAEIVKCRRRRRRRRRAVDVATVCRQSPP